MLREGKLVYLRRRVRVARKFPCATVKETWTTPSNQNAHNPELEKWLAERQSALHIAKTTTTPSGTVLDWVPIESQVASGKIATTTPTSKIQTTRPTGATVFELDDASVECGPAGGSAVVTERRQLKAC